MKLVKQAVQFFCRNAILAEIDRLVSYNVKLLKGLIFSLKAGKVSDPFGFDGLFATRFSSTF